MINFIKNIFSKKEEKDKQLSELSFVDLPGYRFPSIEDLKLEVVLFEKRVKDYALSRNVSLQKSNSHNKSVFDIINELKDLNPYSENDTDDQKWFAHIEELHELRRFRNNIIHIDHSELPSVEELCLRYKDANQKLIPFRINSGCTKSVFKVVKWFDETLEILINNNTYHLGYADIDNLSVQLHPASRGAVYYKSGKEVVVKITDYDFIYLSVFIEGYPHFQITEDEAAILDDLILSMKTEKIYGA